MTTGSTNRFAAEKTTVEERPSPAKALVIPAASSAAETAAAQPAFDSNVHASVNLDDDSWRIEVAARLERYRTRRKPRTPRYPSLLLPFDAPESWSRCSLQCPPHCPTQSPPASSAAVNASSPTAAAQPPTARPLTGEDRAFQSNVAPADLSQPDFAIFRKAFEQASEPARDQSLAQSPEPSAKVIEFPRSAAIPVFYAGELADPILDRPRIVEAPEILPPPPALGGMLIEPAHRELADRHSAVESPSTSAPIARRALAALVDGAVVTAAFATFAAIFLRLNPSLNQTLSLIPVRERLPLVAAAVAAIAITLWMVYEFLFVVYTGSTPGLRASRLRLAAFDGSPLDRRTRRWRVLASLLSALSVGLGYLWCLLDQDGLCWHDRITRTHVQSAK